MWERITEWGETPSGRKPLRVGKCMSGRKCKVGEMTVSRGICKSAQNDEKFLVNLWYD